MCTLPAVYEIIYGTDTRSEGNQSKRNNIDKGLRARGVPSTVPGAGFNLASAAL